MPASIPTGSAELRAWRDATFYRLAMRANRAQRIATLEALHAQGYADVTLTDTTLLANLDVEGTSITGLARKTGITRQAASQQLAQLEKEGYVVREPDPADRRALMVQRTDKGHALLRDALEIVAELEAGYAEILGAKRMNDLKKSLQALLLEVDPEGTLGAD